MGVIEMIGNAQTSVPVTIVDVGPAMTAYMMERNLPLDSDSEEARTVGSVIQRLDYSPDQARQLAMQVNAAEMKNRQRMADIENHPELARDNPSYLVREPIRVVKDTLLAYMNHMREPVLNEKTGPYPVYTTRAGFPLTSGILKESARKEVHWND